MTARVELGVAQRPWMVAEVDLADGLPALPAVDGTGQPVGGFGGIRTQSFGEPFPADLLAANRSGLVHGPAAYWRAWRQQRRVAGR